MLLEENIVDENDLNDALNEGLIAGAAVDVFSKEPAKENVLFNNPKAILTPHIAASTTEVFYRCSRNGCKSTF